MENKFNNIDQYILSFPAEVQQKLQRIRQTIQQVVPEAEEAIKYAMPTFILNGNLVHFAAYKKHIGFYPAPDGVLVFETELEGYKRSKGAIQFPLDQEPPLELIAKIVKFRKQQNLDKAMRLRVKKPSKKETKE